MTDRKPFAASTIRGPLPGESEPAYSGPTDELGYPLDEPTLVVMVGDDRFSADVILLLKGLQSIGFEAVIVLEHGVIYGEQISRSDLSVDWTVLQAGTGRRLAVIKYDLQSREGTASGWRARAAELRCAIVFLERGATHRQEVWDRVCAALRHASLGAPPAEPPGDEVAKRPSESAEQPPEQRAEQRERRGDAPENALATHPGDAASGATPWGHARERDELDQLITLARQPAQAGLDRSAGHVLRTSGDPEEKSRAGRDLAGRRWGRRGS